MRLLVSIIMGYRDDYVVAYHELSQFCLVTLGDRHILYSHDFSD